MIPSHSMLDIQTLERFRLAIFWVEPSKSVSHSWEDSGSLYATHHTHFWWLALNNERYIFKKNEDCQFQLIAAIIQAATTCLWYFADRSFRFVTAALESVQKWYTITAYTRLHSMLYKKVLLCCFWSLFIQMTTKKILWSSLKGRSGISITLS